MSQVVNVLTRTSGRPNYLKENVKSVKSQTYPHIRHIVCADDDESYEYAKKLVDDVIRVKKGVKREEYDWMHSPYNLYCNDLMAQVTEGWVMFLDDDDAFYDENALQRAMGHVSSEENFYVWKAQFHHKVLPSYSFGKGVALCDIGSNCFLFHSKHIWAAQWDEVKESDFRVAFKLFRLLNTKWIDSLVCKINNDRSAHGKEGVGLGRREDKK